jgi:hypothetical protein
VSAASAARKFGALAHLPAVPKSLISIIVTATDCILFQSSLPVHLNMCEPNNGHAPTTSADKYTGTIILRTRPHTYKRVVRLLSEGVPAIRIARDCKVTERSVAAIAKREREEITERKKSLACLMSNIAEIGGANVERKIGKASVRDAIIGTGVAIDKMLALTSQTPAVQIANIVLPSEEERAERRALHDKLDEIAARLKARHTPGGRGSPVGRGLN